MVVQVHCTENVRYRYKARISKWIVEIKKRKEMGCEIDPAFFQDLEHRPKPCINEASGIPQIDLSLLSTVDPTDNDAPLVLVGILAEIQDACKNWGFFQVVNHGVPVELLERVQTESKKFFDLPQVEKRKVKRDAENPLGYFDSEHTKNVRDWKDVFDFMVEDMVAMPAIDYNKSLDVLQILKNQWPVYPPDLRQVCEEYTKSVEKLAFKLLQLVSLSLGLPAKRLDGYFNDQISFVRLNHYPACPVPSVTLGVARHKDAGALTILAQDDVGGLDVKRRTDGEWVRVKPIPNSLIINIGDIIQVWSNDKYESAEHRGSVNSAKERFSIPFFFNPGRHVVIQPLEELTSEKDPPKYKGYNWGEFFKARNTSNF